MRVCLDTSGYSHFRRGMPEAVQTVTWARSVLVPAVVLGELRVGFRLGTRRSESDIWIAALAAREGATVLTSDGHFAHIGRRRVGDPVTNAVVVVTAG